MNKLILLIFTAIAAPILAQNIKIKVANSEVDTVYLIRHFGTKKFMADTSVVDKKGFISYNGSKHKDGMMSVYFAGENKKILDFIKSSKEKSIELEIDFKTLGPEQTVVKVSDENKAFFTYLKEMALGNQERLKIQNEANSEEKLIALNEKMKKYINDFVEKNKNLLVAKFVKMGVEIELPDAPKDAQGNITDSNYVFNYYRAHFFDNLDFSDDRLVNFGLFEQRIENYFHERMMIPIPDTILFHSVNLLERLDKKSDAFQFVLTHLVQKYDKSKIMGHDKVWVMLALRYFCPNISTPDNLIHWLKPEQIEPFCEKANKLKHLVTGVRPHNLTLLDSTNLKWHALFDIKAEYTILYFWEPNCGHCKKETPKLNHLYEEKLKARGVEVYAVGKAQTKKDDEDWRVFIAKNKLSFLNVAVTDWLYTKATEDPYQFVPEFTNAASLNYSEYFDIVSTPKVYILDKDKKIVGKNLSIAQIEEFLDRLQGVSNAPKLYPVSEDKEHKEDH
jgi:thiol-disulfide isomerase/thioredoxin